MKTRSACATAMAVSILFAGAARAEVQPGDPAPDFSLQDLGGTTHTLTAQRGKVVLLDFIGYACQPCLQSSPAVEDIWQDYKETGVFQVLALDFWNGSADLVQSFIDATSVTYPVLRNAGFLQSDAWYGITFDNFVVVDAEGIVRYTSVNEPFEKFNDAALRATIVEYLPVAVEGRTWSVMKSLYRGEVQR